MVKQWCHINLDLDYLLWTKMHNHLCFLHFFLFVYSYLCCFLQLYDTIPINKVGREALFKSNREVLLTLPWSTSCFFIFLFLCISWSLIVHLGRPICHLPWIWRWRVLYYDALLPMVGFMIERHEGLGGVPGNLSI